MTLSTVWQALVAVVQCDVQVSIVVAGLAAMAAQAAPQQFLVVVVVVMLRSAQCVVLTVQGGGPGPHPARPALLPDPRLHQRPQAAAAYGIPERRPGLGRHGDGRGQGMGADIPALSAMCLSSNTNLIVAYRLSSFTDVTTVWQGTNCHVGAGCVRVDTDSCIAIHSPN